MKGLDLVVALGVDSSSKQAYFILTYRSNLSFKTLIQMLDHPKNDIFIHMDAKTKSYNPDETLSLVKHSRIIHTPRRKVEWCGYSTLEAFLLLLEAATSQGKYEHYHLLSESDLPIKKQEDIIKFFEEHHGQEFVNFRSVRLQWMDDWVKLYHPFREKIGRPKRTVINKAWRILNGLCVRFQKLIGFRRNKGIKFWKGSDWFSITDEFARYILSKREWIREVFHATHCPSEQCVHTLILNNQYFFDRLYHKEFDDDILHGSMRLIDWERGKPYVFRSTDLEEIKNSEAMFARKFDENVDADIIRKIQELYS